MPKNIVFCADGTWNGNSEDPNDITSPTNVLKTYHNLDGVDVLETIPLADEQERSLTGPDGSQAQVAKYIHGVGDSDNPLMKILGGALGVGLIARVIRGYTFVSRNYLPGDKIFLLGFSRGAYTARALSGMIASVGLLSPTANNLDDREEGYRLGSRAWRQFRSQALQNDPDALGKLEDLVSMLPGFLSQPLAANQLIPNIPIDTIAVWDTVGSMGIPEFAEDGAQVDALRFVDLKLSAQVACGLHAIAIDERRADFTPCPWDEPDPRITQVMFPGAHADVGGGYPTQPNECGLADGSLAWMTSRLAARGVIFARNPPTVPLPDPCGIGHQPWDQKPWNLLPPAIRLGPSVQMPSGFYLHHSVLARYTAGAVLSDPGSQPAQYRPTNLVNYIDPSDGSTLNGVIVV